MRSKEKRREEENLQISMSEIVQVAKKQRHSDHEDDHKLLVAYTATGRTFAKWERLIILMNMKEEP